MSAEDTFDFTQPLGGPRNVIELEKLMSERGIANDDNLQFDEDFVEQFYDDADNEPGEQSMFNGDPLVWGFAFWTQLFLLAYYYPTSPSANVKRAAYQAVHALRYLLPCTKCIRSFRKHMLEIPIEKYLDSRESFLEFCIEMRHAVDARMGKEPFDVDRFFKKLMASQNDQSKEEKNVETTEKNVSTTQVIQETVPQKKNVLKRVDLQKKSYTSSKKNANYTESSAKLSDGIHLGQKTSYGLVGRQVNIDESLKTVRDAMKRTNLSNQQKANLQKLERSKAVKQIEKPGECKTCGGKPKKPSTF